ncbi:MAG: hypothetical protein QGI21_00075 [Candidatus Poseidoniaceae archaeon]|jgi:hypothetical protein|nr:hypothetical protein [Candidatus Poseidoniaceae archaeon]
MVDDKASGTKLETWLMVSFVAAMLLSTSVIVITSFGKQTVYSAYVTDADKDYQMQQVSAMRNSLGEGGLGYDVANTMSTPMLVNDWREPHRTMMVIAAVEKPFDSAEASAIHDFVTEKGGKVIIASNSTNAQTVASEFGIKFFDAPVADDQRYYEVTDQNGIRMEPDIRKLWAVAGVNKVWDDEFELRPPCSSDDILNDRVDDCAMPVLFHNPTAIQVLEQEDGDLERNVKILAHASGSAFIARQNLDINDADNPVLGAENTGLIIRIDYPGLSSIDRVKGGDKEGEVSVTGSIVFVSDHSVLANHLYDIKDAEVTGKQQCDSEYYSGRSCWNSLLSGDTASTQWSGNSMYFKALMRDMMETDNPEISTTVTRDNENFYVVFDESRHVTSSLSSPFTEAMGAIVMLTSDTMLKWLIVLNLMALLSIAIMVVPEKENWRHVFDLTRFRERPNKVDSNQYLKRVRESMMSKVRQLNDLTRDEFALKTPAEIQTMVRDPRLIELLYSQQRSYSNEELRQLLQQIRRWGK